MLNTNSQVCTVLEKSKEKMLEFYKEQKKFCEYKWFNTVKYMLNNQMHN